MPPSHKKKSRKKLYVLALTVVVAVGLWAVYSSPQPQAVNQTSKAKPAMPLPGQGIELTDEMMMLNTKRAIDDQFEGRGRQLQTTGVYLDATREK